MDKKAKGDFEKFKLIKIFENCGENLLQELYKQSKFKKFRDNETIIGQVKESKFTYFILSGCVFVKYNSHHGKEMFVRAFGSGEIFGEISTFDGRRSNGSFVASGDVTVAAIPKKLFRKICSENAEIAFATLNTLAIRTRWLLRRMIELSTLGAANRVHAELLRIGRNNHVSENCAEIKPSLTHTEIAFRASTQREVVSREINYLKKQNIVRTNRTCLCIDDMARLEEIVDNATGNAGPIPD